MKTVFKVGDKVYDVRYGWGKIDLIYNPNHYPIIVKYKICHISYTLDGKSSHEDLIPLLSLTEYTLQGFSQERPEILPERGQIVWVRNNENSNWSLAQFMWKNKEMYRVTAGNPFDDTNGAHYKFITTENPYTK
jgi:hypothetical protein